MSTHTVGNSSGAFISQNISNQGKMPTENEINRKFNSTTSIQIINAAITGAD
jgi:hypothetical protein